MKTIGFDLDGVLYDFHRVAYNHLTVYHNLKYDYAKFWTVADNLYGKRFMESLIKIPILYEKMDINPNDLNVLNTLDKNYNLVYITHRPEEVKFVTQHWMKSNKIPQRSNLYFCNGSKLNLVIRNQCLYYIDDRFKIIQELEQVTNAILFKKPWHTKEELKQVTYIKSLNELLEIGL